MDAVYNDTRMKLCHDMVSGVRTIKCYGWEDHFYNKIKDIRKKQVKEVFALNFLLSLNQAVYQQFGLIAILIMFTLKWYR